MLKRKFTTQKIEFANIKINRASSFSSVSKMKLADFLFYVLLSLKI